MPPAKERASTLLSLSSSLDSRLSPSQSLGVRHMLSLWKKKQKKFNLHFASWVMEKISITI
jgi:hypothetical protein